MDSIDRAFPTVPIAGVAVAITTVDRATEAILDAATGPRVGRPRYVCATSVHGLIEASRDPSYLRVLNDAWLIAPDGMPLVVVGRMRGRREMQRVFGPALTLSVCEASAAFPIRHFFYGGAPGVAEELAASLSTRFPGLQVAGVHCPPFRPLTSDELDAVADEINDSDADIVWVGLSTPKQERWIAAIRDRLKAKVMLSVGAAFDYHTGRLKPAPSWMQGASLEWLYRLIQEPRRLWRRYAYNNPMFIYLILKETLGRDNTRGLAGLGDHDDG